MLTQLMEDAPDALVVERAMAGSVRLAILPPSDRERLGSPLVKRAEQVLVSQNRGRLALSEWIARLALAWACVPYPPSAWVSDEAAVFPVIPDVRVMLAEPSAADGSVQPDELLARLATWRGAPVLRWDVEAALLRLPSVDASFWAAWDEVHPASAAGARQAYQAGTAKVTLQPVIETAPDRQGRIRVTVQVSITSNPPAAAGGSRCRQLLTDPPDPILHYEYNARIVPGGVLLAAAMPLATRTRRSAPIAAAVRLPRPGQSHADAGATAVMA